jgi:hypothetical protein
MTPTPLPADPPAAERSLVVATLDVEPDPGGPPPYRRLARLLKDLGRRHRVKCIEVAPAPALAEVK